MKTLKTYSNRFATIEEQEDGSWVVINDISGVPLYVDPEADEPEIKTFTYRDAYSALCVLGNRGRSIERGGNTQYFFA